MATKKPQLAKEEKFDKVEVDLFEILAALDRKDYGYYDSLTDEQKKKIVPFMLTHWMSAIKGNEGLSRYYVMSVNEYANKHLFAEYVQKHPKLQWLLLTTVSPAMGKHRHEWIAYNGKTIKNKRATKIIELYPHIKTDEAELLSEQISDAEYKAMLVDRGYSDKEIKEMMK
mgnify:CR=1 FL=1